MTNANNLIPVLGSQQPCASCDSGIIDGALPETGIVSRRSRKAVPGISFPLAVASLLAQEQEPAHSERVAPIEHRNGFRDLRFNSVGIGW